MIKNIQDEGYRNVNFTMKDVKALSKNPNIKNFSIEEIPNIVIISPGSKIP